MDGHSQAGVVPHRLAELGKRLDPVVKNAVRLNRCQISFLLSYGAQLAPSYFQSGCANGLVGKCSANYWQSFTVTETSASP